MSRKDLEERYKELEEREFCLKMKDTWDSGDGVYMSQIHSEMAEIKRQMELLDAQP